MTAYTHLTLLTLHTHATLCETKAHKERWHVDVCLTQVSHGDTALATTDRAMNADTALAALADNAREN